MNPIFNQKYKTTLCRHWQTTGACTIGVRCVFAHGQAELRNPNDPITLNQNILSDPKMLTSFMTTPLGDVAAVNAMVIAQQYQSLLQQTQQLKKALVHKEDQGGNLLSHQAYRNTIQQAKQYMDKPHFDITTDPMVQKRITSAQLKLMTKEMLKMNVHPIIMCKIKICYQLLQADNVDACTIMLNDIIQRKTVSTEQKQQYQRIVQQASQLSIQLIAQEKVKIQRLQKQQQILIRKQQQKHMAFQNNGRF